MNKPTRENIFLVELFLNSYAVSVSGAESPLVVWENSRWTSALFGPVLTLWDRSVHVGPDKVQQSIVLKN